jgi:glycosyltransferase involved in cell wall biosynthesis
MKHKLAYFCGSTSWGGLEMNHLKCARWMSSRGHEVVVCAQAISPLAINAKQEGLSVCSISTHRKYYDFLAAWKLARLVKDENISHLLIRDTKDISVAVLAKRLLAGKLHVSYFMAMQIGVAKRDILHTIRYRGLDVWSCPLEGLAEQVRKFTRMPHERIKVIPDGIEMHRFHHSPEQSEARKAMALPSTGKILGVIGRFDPQKGQLLLVEAFAKLSKFQDLYICMLGEPTKGELVSQTYLKQIEEHLQLNDLIDTVFIRPFRSDVETFYSAIDVLVMASKAETFGMVTVEAMASGKPVIASNAGGSPELLHFGEAGYLFESMNVDALAGQISEWYGNPNQFSEDQLRESVAAFDHQQSCERVEKELGLRQ